MNRKKGAIAAAILALVFLTGFIVREIGLNKKVQEYDSTGFVMDTVLQQTIYSNGDDPSGEILDILKDLENRCISWTDPASEMAGLNAGAGKEMQVSGELYEILQNTVELSAASDGALDPTMGEVIRLWDFGGGNPHVPDPAILDQMLEKVDYRKVRLENNEVFLPEGVTLDLGAVGKGAGCDKIADYLENHPEITGCLMNLGSSSIMTWGTKPDGSPWKIGIRDPGAEDPSEYLGIVELEGTNYLSTSGSYEKYFVEDGVKYHHILDPKTGCPADSGLASVTVVARDGLISDGLSTACFVLGLEEGRKLLQSYDAAGIFITTEREIITEGAIHFQ